MKVRIAEMLAFVVLFTCFAPRASAYDPTWRRSEASTYAWWGLKERYVYGGSTFRNNDRWDGDEGADCSGYAAKVWAVANWTWPMTRYHPYSTWSFLGGTRYSHFGDRRYGSWMNFWVYSSRYGPGDHMGMFRQPNSDGTWQTYEARGSAYGIVIYRRAISTLISWGYRRVDRNTWGDDY